MRKVFFRGGRLVLAGVSVFGVSATVAVVMADLPRGHWQGAATRLTPIHPGGENLFFFVAH
jgi:hypothetical protein